MEWVETTGKTLEEATDAALAALGVAAADAEVQVLEEARPGLFGRMRGEFRVKVRVRPTTPRAKDSGRRRRPAQGVESDGAAAAAGPAAGAAAAGAAGAVAAGAGAVENGGTDGDQAPDVVSNDGGADEAAESGDEATSRSDGDGGQNRRRRRRRRGGKTDDSGNGSGTEEESVDGATLDQQADEARAFMDGLVAAFGLTATTTVRTVDDETREVTVDGGDLGLLIGAKGSTLAALQDLMRTAVQKGPDRHGRLILDVAGYRQKRGAALARFSTQVADDVVASGNPVALEPMSAADRKVVHDTVNAIDGVVTSSEGEEPRRWVVIRPA